MIPINLTIGLVILAAVAVVGSAYLIATLASAIYLDCPYRTPLSFPCWRGLQAFRLGVSGLSSLALGGWLQWRLHHGSLEDLREKEATRRYSDSLLARDTRALQWTVDNLIENVDFEPFAASIPALLNNYYTRTVLEQMLSSPACNLPKRISDLLQGCLQSNVSSPWNPAADNMVLTSLRATFSMTEKLAWRSWRDCANHLTATYLPLLSFHSNPIIAHYAVCSAAVAKYRLANDLIMPTIIEPNAEDTRKNIIALNVLGGQAITRQVQAFPARRMKSEEPPTPQQHSTLRMCRSSILRDFCARIGSPEFQRVDFIPQTEGGEVLMNTVEVITTVVYHPAYDSDDAFQWDFVQSLGDFIFPSTHTSDKTVSPSVASLPVPIVYYIFRRFAGTLTQRSGARREARRIWERYMAENPTLGSFSRWFGEVGQDLGPGPA
ncbi:hypothetical protein HWV62_11536 [Athelia sp. TMB]|nr:hypothetical protein HWV62_11536 [Athelia sp. TMB]